MTSGRPDSGQVSSESAMAKRSGVRKKVSQISHAWHQDRLRARRLYEAQKKTKQLQREQQAISLVRAAINSTAEAKIKALEHEIVELKSLVTQKAQLIKARDAEKAQLIKDKHDVTVYHMSHHDKLYEKIKKLKEQNEKLNKSLQALMDDLAEMEAKLQPFKAENIVNDIDKIAKLVNVKLKDKIAKLTAKDCQADCQAQNDLLKAENEIAKLTAQNNAAGDEVCQLKKRLKTDKAEMEAKLQEREKEIVELKNLVAEAGQQNGKLMAEKAQLIKDRDDVKERNEKLKSENAKLWHQNDAMAEAGLKRMAKSGF